MALPQQKGLSSLACVFAFLSGSRMLSENSVSYFPKWEFPVCDAVSMEPFALARSDDVSPSRNEKARTLSKRLNAFGSTTRENAVTSLMIFMQHGVP